jgi:hypothetical protein
MKKKLCLALILLVVVLLAIQLVPVERSNPPVSADVAAPPAVAEVLKRSCYDCHSNETRWPWYSAVAPASFLVANHVSEGRAHVNFSQWSDYEPERRRQLLQECWEEIDEGEMPEGMYLLMHGEAALTEGDKQLLHEWIVSIAGSGDRPGARVDFDEFADGK